MRWAIFLIWLFLVTSIGCRNDSISQSDLISGKSIDIELVNSNQKEISFFDIFSKMEIVPLELTKASAIKAITKLEYYKNRYYILDKEQYALLVFDSLGKFIYKIQREGRGPGEYSLLYDFCINKFSNEIELLNPRGSILRYSIEGDFIDEMSIPVRAASNFSPITSDLYVLYSPYEAKKLLYYSKSRDDIIKKEYSFDDILLKTPMINPTNSPFLFQNNEITFYQGFSNIVYTINDTLLQEKLIWNFIDYNIDISLLEESKPLEYYPIFLRNSSFVHSFGYFIENEDYILTRFMFKRKWNTLFYSKMDKNYYLVIRFPEGVYPAANLNIINRGLLGFVEPSQIDLVVNAKILDTNQNMVLNKVKLEDNPVILKYTFKNVSH